MALAQIVGAITHRTTWIAEGVLLSFYFYISSVDGTVLERRVFTFVKSLV